MTLNYVLDVLIAELKDILGDHGVSVMLYGSAAAGDFCPGWSDIDFIALTELQLGRKAEQLLHLRQALCEQYQEPLFCSLEGVILPGWQERTVYWGTSGERICNGYQLDCFGRQALLAHGVLLCGCDFRQLIIPPTRAELIAGVRRHYEAVRNYAATPPWKITSFGWLLDIAQGMYTLEVGEYSAKTAAGEWALARGIVPEDARPALELAVALRKNPGMFAQLKEFPLGDAIQKFADILQVRLEQHE